MNAVEIFRVVEHDLRGRDEGTHVDRALSIDHTCPPEQKKKISLFQLRVKSSLKSCSFLPAPCKVTVSASEPWYVDGACTLVDIMSARACDTLRPSFLRALRMSARAPAVIMRNAFAAEVEAADEREIRLTDERRSHAGTAHDAETARDSRQDRRTRSRDRREEVHVVRRSESRIGPIITQAISGHILRLITRPRSRRTQ